MRHWLDWVEWPIPWAGSHRQTPGQVTVERREAYVVMKTFSSVKRIASFHQQQYTLYEKVPSGKKKKRKSKESWITLEAKLWKHQSRNTDLDTIRSFLSFPSTSGSCLSPPAPPKHTPLQSFCSLRVELLYSQAQSCPRLVGQWIVYSALSVLLTCSGICFISCSVSKEQT